MGHFYFLFIWLDDSFVTVLCPIVRMVSLRGTMIKLDPTPTPLTYVAHPDVDVESVHRLIVLIPADTDNSAAMRRIWELANATGMQVQLLGLCKDTTEEPGLRRELVTMASLLQGGKVSAELKIESGTIWVEAVKRNYQAGDMVVCFAEQRAGLLQRPLSQILQADLDVPVYILSGLSPQSDPRSKWLTKTAPWMGSIAIIVVFFILQTRINLRTSDWAQTTLMLLSTAVEVWAIWIWNSLFE